MQKLNNIFIYNFKNIYRCPSISCSGLCLGEERRPLGASAGTAQQGNTDALPPMTDQSVRRIFFGRLIRESRKHPRAVSWRAFMKYAPVPPVHTAGSTPQLANGHRKDGETSAAYSAAIPRSAKKSAGVDASTLRGPVPAKRMLAHLYNHTLVNVRAQTAGQSLINRFIWHPGCFSL